MYAQWQGTKYADKAIWNRILATVLLIDTHMETPQVA